jgi:3D (Asp-Asp-Asp) domain-containing protein
LPQYEPPLARSDFQTVRTTAYTHTESDHREFTNHNALGGELHAAGPPIHRAENVPRAIPVDGMEDVGVRRVSNSGATLQPFSIDGPRTTTRVTTTTRITKTTRGVKRAIAVAKPLPIGSAAADWSRWPMGTTFRLLSTGQMYRVDDYGWALSGRNTIDLYMANQRDMNSWGARQETIQILQWGDPQQSLQFLQSHQDYRHIKRMVLEIEGRDREAAGMQ